MKSSAWLLFGWLLVAALPVRAQYSYTTNGNTFYFAVTNSKITITNYSGAGGAVSVPGTISNLSVAGLGSNAFAGSFLSSVTIPSNVITIGAGVFSACYELTNVFLTNGLGAIGDFAFDYCSGLTNVAIPASVTNIGAGPFANCSSLTAITVAASNSAYSSLAGVLFNKHQTALLQFPIGNAADSYTIPGTVTAIGNSAFASSENLTNVTIPGSVTSIGANAFIYSFLNTITIPNSVTNIGSAAFAYSFLTGVTLPNGVTSIGDSVFAGSSLTDVAIPDGVTSIGNSAFYECSSLTNVIISDSVTSIGTNAFAATSLASITLPGSVTNIGDYAFANCGGLTAVYFEGNAPAADLTAFVYVYQGNNYYVTAYYLPNTTGWAAFSANTDVPTAPWTLPQPWILNNSSRFGLPGGPFKFTVYWNTNASVIVQAATNLVNPVWTSLATNTLTNGTYLFSDPQWSNNRVRYYRVTTP